MLDSQIALGATVRGSATTTGTDRTAATVDLLGTRAGYLKTLENGGNTVDAPSSRQLQLLGVAEPCSFSIGGSGYVTNPRA